VSCFDTAPPMLERTAYGYPKIDHMGSLKVELIKRNENGIEVVVDSAETGGSFVGGQKVISFENLDLLNDGVILLRVSAPLVGVSDVFSQSNIRRYDGITQQLRLDSIRVTFN
jgi:hypothetical protein